MIRPLLFLLIFFSALTGKTQENKKDTSLKRLVYGDVYWPYCEAENVVAKKYGFSLRVVAGCVVSQTFMKCVDRENKRVNEILEQRFGVGWEKKFYKEVDAMMKLQAKVEALVKKEPYMVAKIKELKNVGLSYFIEPVEVPNSFIVKVCGWGNWNGENSSVVYFKFTVNLATKTVRKESDTIELFEHPLEPKKEDNLPLYDISV